VVSESEAMVSELVSIANEKNFGDLIRGNKGQNKSTQSTANFYIHTFL
jgi:hypothetical protein